MDKNRTSEKVDDYIENLSEDTKGITEELRELVLNTSDELVEEFKWSMPNYTYKGLAVYLQASSKHVNFGIHNGGQIVDKDVKKLLEGSGDKMKHIKIKVKEDIDHEYFTMLIKEIMNYNDVK